MPFRSQAQRRWMHAQKPAMAERWEKETPEGAALPEHVAKKGKIKKADVTLYHGSPVENDPSIMEHGLLPKRALSHNMAYSQGDLKKLKRTALQRQSVHLADNPYYAALYGMHGPGGEFDMEGREPNVYGVRFTDEEFKKLTQKEPERSLAMGEDAPMESEAYIHHGPIAPGRLVPLRGWDALESAELPAWMRKGAEFPNAAGPEDWDTVADSPWKKDQPNLTREKAEIKEKQSQGGTVEDLETGDPRQLMPHLRAIHKMGHVKQAAGDADLDPGVMADARALADIQAMNLPPGFSPTGRISPEMAKMLFVLSNRRRLQQIQQGLLEEELMRHALGKIGHVAPRMKTAAMTPEIQQAIQESQQLSSQIQPIYQQAMQLRGLGRKLQGPMASTARPGYGIGHKAGTLLGGAALGYGLYRLGKHVLGRPKPPPQPQGMPGPMGKIGHIKEAEIFAWPEDMTQAQWNEMLERHPEQEAQRVRRSRGASVGTLTGALGAAMGAAGLGGLAARHNKWLAIPAGALGAVGGAALGGGLGYGAGYALPSPAAERARQEAEQEAAAARLVDPSRFRKEAQGEFEYAETGPNAGQTGYDPPRVWKLPGQLKRAAGLDQEENLDDQERGTDPPAAQPQPAGERLRTLAQERGPIRKIALASYQGLLDELQKLGEVADNLDQRPPKESRGRAISELIRKGAPALGVLAGTAWGLHRGRQTGEMGKEVLTGMGTGALLGSIPEALGSGYDALRRYREVTR